MSGIRNIALAMAVAAASGGLSVAADEAPREPKPKAPKPAAPTEPDGMSRQRRRWLKRRGLI